MAGRPRDTALEQRLLEAAWTLLVRDGYDRLTPTAVAAEAGAHRSDVYRRWSSKPLLVTESLASHLPAVSAADTGSLRGDLQAYVSDLAVSWSAPWMDGLVGLLGDLRTDPDAELAFRVLGEARGAAARESIARAVERGEIAADVDLDVLGDLLEGPLMHRRLIARGPLTPDYLERLVDTALRVLARPAGALR